MTAALNYIIEANLGLVLILAVYRLLLQGETNFRLLRLFLLSGIFASLLFPLIHIQSNQGPSPFSISQVMPSYWLPEVVVGGEGTEAVHEASFNFWKYTTLVYYTGVIIVCLIVIFQLIQLFRIIRRSTTYRLKQLYIAESTDDKPIFSFFQFIFIGQAHNLSSNEKQQIIQHESVHAHQWHSFDILLINVLKIFFWFNPFINTYKKTFIQLHEFEADARAVENSDLNKYCSLLARVALQSAGFTLVNYFNNSLTVKRIEMMKTLKTKIKEWKLIALVMVVPIVFFFIACQDQIENDLTEITRNSTHALMVPAHIQSRFEELKKENPDKNYVLLELNETATTKIQSLEAQYGLPKSMEVFKVSEGKTVSSMKGEADQVVIEKGNTPQAEGQQTFAIIEFNDEASRIASASQEDKIFTVVEEQPEFDGGYDAMVNFIRQNLRYPAEARTKGIEGTVYVSFVVGKDGSVSEVKTIRGLSGQVDNEAMRVVSMFPNWVPGKQSGEAVNVRFVLPVKFNLNQSSTLKK